MMILAADILMTGCVVLEEGAAVEVCLMSPV